MGLYSIDRMEYNDWFLGIVDLIPKPGLSWVDRRFDWNQRKFRDCFYWKYAKLVRSGYFAQWAPSGGIMQSTGFLEMKMNLFFLILFLSLVGCSKPRRVDVMEVTSQPGSKHYDGRDLYNVGGKIRGSSEWANVFIPFAPQIGSSICVEWSSLFGSGGCYNLAECPK